MRGTPSIPADASSLIASTGPAAAELEPARPLEELLAELDGLVGLENVKAEVRRLTSLLRIQRLRAERDLPTMETSHHLVFTGNPGTGKTTVARLLSEIFRTLGVLFPDHTSDELLAIFELIGNKAEYHLDDDARTALRTLIDAEPRDRGFGNARFVRNAFESAVAHQALRLAEIDQPTDEVLTTLTAADIVAP